MCQCPPKCVKCCKAATISRSTIHVLHGAPQPQHSWPWEPRTLGTNSGSWLVANDVSSESTRTITMKNDSEMNIKIDSPNDVFSESRNDSEMSTPSKIVKDEHHSEMSTPSKMVKNQKNLPPLMSLTLRRKEKKKAKKKKQNDLRLLLEKKNTQKHSYHEVNIFIVLKICVTVAHVVVINVLT